MKKLFLLSSMLFLIASFAYCSDYTVTGATDPSACNGDYSESGTEGGKPAYDHNTESYSIWWDEMAETWAITTTADRGTNLAPPLFYKMGDPITGNYTEEIGLGDVVVSAYEGGGNGGESTTKRMMGTEGMQNVMGE